MRLCTAAQIATTIEVRMIEIFVQVINLFGLPIGAHVHVADANASKHDLSIPKVS